MEGPSPEVVAIVKRRARGKCEHCHLPAGVSESPFQMDHVVARKHGGGNEPGNLAYACFYCNSYKGPNLSGVDPLSGEVVRLFNPRVDRWNEQFEWRQAWLTGISPQGRATVQTLNINNYEARYGPGKSMA